MFSGILLSLVLAGTSAASASHASAQPFFATVTHVTSANSLLVSSPDGETIQVTLAFIVIPSPPQPFGGEANAFLRSELLNRRVSVRPIGHPTGSHVNAVVYRGSANFNLSLLESGYAWVDFAQPMHPQWNLSQHRAMTARRGLFADDDATHPRIWRQELDDANVVLAAARRMLQEESLPELLSRTYIGHRDLGVFVQTGCVHIWAEWPVTRRVPLTSRRGAAASGYQFRECDAVR